MTGGLEVAIVGAGGFGREVLQYCADAQEDGWPYSVVGFFDDRLDALNGYNICVPVLGTLIDLKREPARVFIIAIGDPAKRGLIARIIDEMGGQLVSLIHPTAYVARTAEVSPGVVLCPFTLVATGARVGSNVAVNVYSSIGHDSQVGEHCVISPYSAITGDVKVGPESLLGTHCTVAPGKSIGRRSKVSAGSVVCHDAEAGSLLIGNPAKGRVIFPAN